MGYRCHLLLSSLFAAFTKTGRIKLMYKVVERLQSSIALRIMCLTSNKRISVPMHESYIDRKCISQTHVWFPVLNLLKFCDTIAAPALVYDCRHAFPR